MQATVQDILRVKGTKVFSVAPTATVDDAVDTMNAFGIGSVLVLHAGHVQGIVSERDILRRLVAKHRDPRHTLVTEIMTRHLWTVAPQSTVAHAMELVSTMRCRHLPVIGSYGLAGMISSGDLAAWQQRELDTEVYDLTSYICGPAAKPEGAYSLAWR
jgi:CBS domain-containing protein